MKVSIITVTYNAEKTLLACINSVHSQTHKNIEHILIDGASTDKTMEIVGRYQQNFSHIVSEPDNGIYDAMNKGIRLATGSIVGILNSDDSYADNTTIETVIKAFETDSSIGCVYGNIEYVEKKNNSSVIRKWNSKPYIKNLFNTGWHPPHPAFFVRREVYLKFGLYRTELSIAADYEMMLRLIQINHVKCLHVPITLVKMKMGGVSNKSLRNIIKANLQVLKAWKLNHQKIPYLVFIKKPFSKLKQYLWKKR